MVELHLVFWNGTKESVRGPPYEEFLMLEEEVETLADLKSVAAKAEEADAPTDPLLGKEGTGTLKGPFGAWEKEGMVEIQRIGAIP